MSRKRIAIVGSGIAGMASAWFLHHEYDVTLFEKEARLGGHSNTVMVPENGNQIPIDTGFMVYNEVTYPLLTRLFNELDVSTQATSMSFSVQHLNDRLEFNGGSLNLLFGQRSNLLNLRYWKMLLQINRFNRETIEELRDSRFGEMPLREYVKVRGYGDDFLRWYLSPMAAAVWSSPPERIDQFPARTLMRFWHNHGFLGLDTQHPWRTVTGGSRNYVEKLTAPLSTHIRRESGVQSISALANGKAYLSLLDGSHHEYDQVIIAAHGDQALAMLSDATPLEKDLLARFPYQTNQAVLHTDSSVMPKTRRCWASWNYRIDAKNRCSTHYWMNELQNVSQSENYFVSINPSVPPAAEKVKRHMAYEHPLFDLRSITAQNRLPELHRAGDQTGRYFCGAWQRYGFHEDGLWSAVNVSTQILGRDPWQ